MANPVLSVRKLGKDYGARTAVASLDLDVLRGEILGLLGPNGAGKTTTISMACGVVTPSRGSVEICGVSLAKSPYAAKRKLGLVPQELAVYEELSSHQNLAYFGALYGLSGDTLAKRIRWALGVVGLEDRAREPVTGFSGGMKRRLNIACGLVHEPEVLVLDEPTVGVDPQSRNYIFETVRKLREQGTTVVYTSHYMEEVEALCDRVAIMDAGAIVALGTIGELVSKYAGKGVELELAGNVDAAITAMSAYGSVERQGASLRVVPTAALAPVIAAIEGAGATIAKIESRQANLETAFLALTGKALRDAAEGKGAA
ncbi:MAG TPA: ABC transporter ATP-binding protein [Kofleriaceae bacterium]|nr:ABC transporter ATP-binding protein [Kofleriaceae bacterium]